MAPFRNLQEFHSFTPCLSCQSCPGFAISRQKAFLFGGKMAGRFGGHNHSRKGRAWDSRQSGKMTVPNRLLKFWFTCPGMCFPEREDAWVDSGVRSPRR
jgi:hypothetical protein